MNPCVQEEFFEKAFRENLVRREISAQIVSSLPTRAAFSRPNNRNWVVPISLQLLQAGDDAAWQQACDEWGLWHVARQVVACYLPHHLQHVEDVASIAVRELVDAVRRIRDEPGIEDRLRAIVAHFLRRLARWRALGFLERRWAQREQPLPEEQQEGEQREINVEAFVNDDLRFVLHYKAVIDELAEAAELDVLEKALLREHVVEGLTQQEFANKYGIPLGTVGNLKLDVLGRLRAFFQREDRPRGRIEPEQRNQTNPRPRERAEPPRRNAVQDRRDRHRRPNSKGKWRGKRKTKISRRKKSSRTD